MTNSSDLSFIIGCAKLARIIILKFSSWMLIPVMTIDSVFSSFKLEVFGSETKEGLTLLSKKPLGAGTLITSECMLCSPLKLVSKLSLPNRERWGDFIINKPSFLTWRSQTCGDKAYTEIKHIRRYNIGIYNIER